MRYVSTHQVIEQDEVHGDDCGYMMMVIKL
jgi:hypothetical protein